jgi:cell division protein FtsI (penicillin-binding protein 3)
LDDAGQEGVELAFQSHLAGTPGTRRVLKDRLGRVVEDVESIRSAQDGRDLALSIDGKLQSLAFGALQSAVELHRAKAGALIAVDVRSGEVLALVNVPSFNPNNRARLTGHSFATARSPTSSSRLDVEAVHRSPPRSRAEP